MITHRSKTKIHILPQGPPYRSLYRARIPPCKKLRPLGRARRCCMPSWGWRPSRRLHLRVYYTHTGANGPAPTGPPKPRGTSPPPAPPRAGHVGASRDVTGGVRSRAGGARTTQIGGWALGSRPSRALGDQSVWVDWLRYSRYQSFCCTSSASAVDLYRSAHSTHPRLLA